MFSIKIYLPAARLGIFFTGKMPGETDGLMK
jgi:hypothetical protein